MIYGALDPNLERFMWGVFEQYAEKLGVKLVRDQDDNGSRTLYRRRRRWTWHPSINGVGFNKRRREVHCYKKVSPPDPADRFAERPDNSPTWMPHEATHVVWPWLHDSALEWDSGMIPFELAWLDRLCGPSPIGREAFDEFVGYAEDGVPGDGGAYKVMQLPMIIEPARAEVRRLKLPDPWELP